MMSPATLDREGLERLPREALGTPSPFRPSVWRVETPGGAIVVKDARHTVWATRWIARWLLSRERRILGLLGSLDGVPHIIAAIDSDSFSQTLVPGRPLDKQLFCERPREIMEQILHLAGSLHAIGVFHLDLHQRRNLLLDDQGRLYMVDFGAAVAPGPWVRAVLGGILRHADQQAAYKYMARFAPEALREAEARAVVRHRRLRWLWPFTAHSRREIRAARERLR
jgi:predicted Ser/Thr protein kinase